MGKSDSDSIKKIIKDTKRSEILQELQIMDSVSEKEFDDIVELASAICKTPISLVSLLDNDRQWFKARVGLDSGQTPIEQAFCLHAITTPDEVFVVEDATKDPRFKDNPLVTTAPDIRFYAGAPLFGPDKTPIGTLCVIDRVPRTISEKDKETLKILARKTNNLLELRAENFRQKNEIKLADKELKDTLNRLKEAQILAQLGSWEWVLRKNTFQWSDQMWRLFDLENLSKDSLTFSIWQNRVHADDIEVVKDSLRKAIRGITTDFMEYRIKQESGNYIWVQGTCIPIMDEDGLPVKLRGTALNINNRKNAEHRKSLYLKGLEDTLFDISHRIRKPVATCLGYIEMSEKSDASMSATEVKQMAKFIKDSVLEMDTIINALSKEIHEKKDHIEKAD